MIRNQDLEDLILLKELQESGELEKIKQVREEFKHILDHILSLFEKLYELSRAFGDNLHQLRSLKDQEEKLKKEILKKQKAFNK